MDHLSVNEAARKLGLSASYLNKAWITGDGPSYLKLGRRVFYSIGDLEAWVASRRRRNTSVQPG